MVLNFFAFRGWNLEKGSWSSNSWRVWRVCWLAYPRLPKLHITLFQQPTNSPFLRRPIAISPALPNLPDKMELRNLFFLVVSLFSLSANAQFGFFDQMFGGGGGAQQQAQQQNVRSDAAWYQQQYEGGMWSSPPSFHLHPHPHPYASTSSTSLTLPQHTATSTSAPAPCPASTSRTTAPAPGSPWRIKSSWARGLPCVRARAGIRRGRRCGRFSGRGRGCCELGARGDLG